MEALSLDEVVLANSVNVGNLVDLFIVRLLTQRGRLVICLRVVDCSASIEGQLRLEMLDVHGRQA